MKRYSEIEGETGLKPYRKGEWVRYSAYVSANGRLRKKLRVAREALELILMEAKSMWLGLKIEQRCKKALTATDGEGKP